MDPFRTRFQIPLGCEFEERSGVGNMREVALEMVEIQEESKKNNGHTYIPVKIQCIPEAKTAESSRVHTIQLNFTVEKANGKKKIVRIISMQP